MPGGMARRWLKPHFAGHVMIGVDQVRQALSAGGIAHEVVVYDGADHGFFCDQRATYHEASAADAWTRVTSLFQAELA